MIVGVLFLERVQKSILPRSFEKIDPGNVCFRNINANIIFDTHFVSILGANSVFECFFLEKCLLEAVLTKVK